jgi:hypothetical protein
MCVLLGLVLLGLLPGRPAQATTFTVTNTADSGAGSLRQAMLDANAQQVTGMTACAAHNIVFNIPGTGPHTIRPLSPLPAFAIGITLDGFTQPGSSPNSLLLGNNAVFQIELDGSLAGAADGLSLPAFIPSLFCNGSGSIIRGLVINRFAGSAISMGVTACPIGATCTIGAIRIVGNFIGTDRTGTVALGNGGAGAAPAIRLGNNSVNVVIGDAPVDVGGPTSPSAANRNVIAGNTGDGVYIVSLLANGSNGNTVRSNFIGVAADGITAMGNGRHGVFVDVGSSGTRIDDNVIAANPGNGVRILDNASSGTLTGNAIGVGVTGVALGNGGDGVYIGGTARGVGISRRASLSPTQMPSIANNGGAGVFVDGDAVVDSVTVPIGNNTGLGFDIAPAGVNANDALDADGGPNEGLNRPSITSLSLSGVSTLTIQGNFHGAPNATHEIYFFRNTACDASGAGEGAAPMFNGNIPVFVSVATNASGDATFNLTGGALAGEYITALARRFTTVPNVFALEVSEYSDCKLVVGDPVFSNGFE